MELKGNLDTMPIPDILQWIADSQKTGTLVLTYKTERKEIYFKEGLIVSASSNLNKDRFGVLVVKEGFVTQEELLKLLDESKLKGKLLGKLCVEKGLISEENARRMLQQQAEKIIESLFHRREGEFVFQEGKLPEQDLVQISVAMHQLFFDSASKRNEWKRIRENLGSMDTVLIPVSMSSESLASLNEYEQSLLTLCNRKNSIIDICSKHDKNDFEICNTLTRLLDKGWLKKETKTSSVTDEELQENLWQASIMLEQKRFLKAVSLLESLHTKFPGREDVESLLKKSTKLMREDSEKVLENDKMIPKISSGFTNDMLKNLNLSPQDWFTYSRINGQMTLRELYMVTGMSKTKTQGIVYKLLKMGAIDITGQSANKTTDSHRINVVKIPPKIRPNPIPPPPTTTSKTIETPDPKESQTSKSHLTRTAEFAIPDRFLRKDIESQSNNDTLKPEAPDLKELDQTYSRFLKMNHYQILNIPQTSSPKKLRDAFGLLARKFHPDTYGRLPKPVQDRLEELFSIVNHAYSALSNPNTRKLYDEQIWADDRFGKKNLDTLAAMIQTSPNPIFESIPKPSSRPSTSSSSTASKKKNPPPKDDAQPVIQKDKADDLVDEPKKTEKEKWTLINEEGIELLKAGKTTQAIEKFDSSIKLNARCAISYYYLSRAQHKLGKPGLEKAEDNVKKALVLNPENGRFFCHLGRIYISKGLTSEAERFIKTALAWEPESQEAKKLLKQIKDSEKQGLFSKFMRRKN